MQDDKPYKDYAVKSGLVYAIERAGGQANLANMLGVHQSTVSGWLAVDAIPRTTVNEGTGIARAVSAAGGQVPLAHNLGVTQQAVAQWLRRAYVPASRAREIENLYGVPRAELISPKLRNAAGADGVEL